MDTRRLRYGQLATGLALSVALGGCYEGTRGGGAGETDGDGEGDDDGADDGAGTADDGDDDAGEDDGGVPGECDELDGLSPTHMRRLSHREFENTVAAMLEDLDAETSQSIMDDLAGVIGRVPDDTRESFGEQLLVGAVFDGMDHTASQVHIDRYYDVARAFARQITSSDARLATFVGDCIVDGDPGNDTQCIDDFVVDFGRRALRRPLTEDERSFFVDDVYTDEGTLVVFERGAVEDTIVAMLLSPQFLYHLEDSGDPLDGQETVLALGAHELASRLSYALWMAPPDAALRAAADAGSLLEAEVYGAQVDRLLDDARAQRALDDFFAQWWTLEETADPSQSVGAAQYDAFAGSQSPSPELRDAMLAEIRDLTRNYVWNEEGTFEDLWTSDRSFAASDELAALYGVPTWSPGTEAPTFPDGERAGVLTRAALLVNGSTRTRPIMKGRRVLQDLLCQTVPPPPDNVSTEVDLPAPYTTREHTEALTEQEGSSCATCHLQLNPFGFATEGYDALGRHRTEEVVFDADGNELGRLPVDTSVDVAIAGEMQTIDGAVQLSALLAEDERARTCFSRHFFRYAYHRAEDTSADECLLDDLATRVRDGDSLRSVVRSVVMSPSFALRNLED